MGINNLLKFLKPYVQSVHIKKYAGKRVGIDAYSWLHKGAYSCSMELCLNAKGDKKFQYLNYFMHRINMLQHHNVIPVVVFDGGNIPCKAITEDERHRKRKSNLDMAMEKLKEGDKKAASELFQRAVSITPLMAHELIQILRSENIEFVVAPYEADAQLAYLSSLDSEVGGVMAVISEDSDLLAYGCPAVVFKMDRYGNGEEIVLDKVFNTIGRLPSFKNFDQGLFTGMCVLAGCDFLPSVPGVGIAKAHIFVAKYRNFDRVLSTLKFEKGKEMPEDYPKAFREAIAVFQHARVYDAVSKQLKPLKPLPLDLMQCQYEELAFLGPDLSPSIAIAIAVGNLDPCTMKAFDHFPGPRSERNSYVPNSTNLLLRHEDAIRSTQEGCFTIVSRHRAAIKRVKGYMPHDSMFNNLEKPKPKGSTDNVLHSGEALALKKLVYSFKGEASKENAEPTGLVSNIPNNPFKKRKLDEVQMDEVVSIDEQSSQVTEIQNSEVHSTPTSQESVNSMPIKSTYITSRKKSEKLRKQAPSNHIESKTNSILNFFSRV